MAISYSKGHHAELTAKHTRDVVQYELILNVNMKSIEIILIYSIRNVNKCIHAKILTDCLELLINMLDMN